MRFQGWHIVLALALLSACKDDPPIKTDFGYNYQPLSVGQWVEYDVDSIVYDDFAQTVTTYAFFVRETVVETFEDAEGRTSYRVERSKREAETDEWKVYQSYALVLDGIRLERVDNNLRTVPLIFPPEAGEDWNGNAFNTLDEESYTYDYVDRKVNFGPMTLDSTLRVIQNNDTDNFVLKTYTEERYARDVGLVYKEFLDLEIQISGDSGLHWIQVVRDFGN